MHTYVTTKELEKMAFRMNSQNIKQNFGTQVNFISEIKPQKERFLARYDCFFGNLCVHFRPLLGWECVYVCQHLRTEKGDIWDKYLEYKTSN